MKNTMKDKYFSQLIYLLTCHGKLEKIHSDNKDIGWVEIGPYATNKYLLKGESWLADANLRGNLHMHITLCAA